MSRLLPRVAGLGMAALLLAGCAGDASSSARDAVADITEDANARDADAVRQGVDDLIAQLQADVRSGDLDGTEVDPIIAAARSVQERVVGLEDQEPEPTPEPDPTEESTPTPTSTPSPEPEPTEEPEPTSEPEPTQEPTQPPDEDEDEGGKGNDKGKGKGNGNQDEDEEDDEVVPSVPATVVPG